MKPLHKVVQVRADESLRGSDGFGDQVDPMTYGV